MHNIALTIAGSDPSGGAGLQADLKTFSTLGVYGMAVPAALTAQSTTGVVEVRGIPPAFMKAQLDALLADISPDAAKTGMLLDAKTISLVAGAVKGYTVPNLVVDPVMVSTSGKRLLRKNALKMLIAELLPLAGLVMPNIPEAEVLAGMKVEDVKDMEEAARVIRRMGPGAVLVKGGHLSDGPVDVLYDGKKMRHYEAKRVTGKKLHGTGCVFSAAVTAGLAKGMALAEAVANAKEFVTCAIEAAGPVGKGRVPVV
jgi:hydroxymethylpyrimidine/phosphomethylpyrimidine kinase